MGSGNCPRTQAERGSLADVEKFARRLFQPLWRLDFLAMALNR
jgi:hypothetical protein